MGHRHSKTVDIPQNEHTAKQQLRYFTALPHTLKNEYHADPREYLVEKNQSNGRKSKLLSGAGESGVFSCDPLKIRTSSWRATRVITPTTTGTPSTAAIASMTNDSGSHTNSVTGWVSSIFYKQKKPMLTTAITASDGNPPSAQSARDQNANRALNRVLDTNNNLFEIKRSCGEYSYPLRSDNLESPFVANTKRNEMIVADVSVDSESSRKKEDGIKIRLNSDEPPTLTKNRNNKGSTSGSSHTGSSSSNSPMIVRHEKIAQPAAPQQQRRKQRNSFKAEVKFNTDQKKERGGGEEARKSKKKEGKLKSEKTKSKGESGEGRKSFCCKPVAPPVFIESFNRYGSGEGEGCGRRCLNPADRLKNVDVVEELCYYVPAPETSSEGQFDYYCINECGEMELVNYQEESTSKNENCYNPVKYSRRQRFNFRNSKDEDDECCPRLPVTCNCDCCRAGLRRNPNCCCCCCQTKGVARSSNSFDEIPVGKNAEIQAKQFPVTCSESSIKSTGSSSDDSSNKECDDLLPKESGVYFYDAKIQRFVRQDRPVTPCPIIIEAPPPPPPPPTIFQTEEPRKKQVVQPIIQPVVVPPPCPPPCCPPPCCCCKKSETPNILPVMMCGGFNGGRSCRPPPCCYPPPRCLPRCPMGRPLCHPPPRSSAPQQAEESSGETETQSESTLTGTGSGSSNRDITATVVDEGDSIVTTANVPRKAEGVISVSVMGSTPTAPSTVRY